MPNRLALEPSPYLKQHADNPVDWYPWGAEAIERATREDKPILLSIGYSACHWCHVMAHESFENDEIARRMNESFVNVKVDREERPDLDQVYQLVVQLMGRSGGWPLTVFLTPRQRPFFGGTYFPPVDRYGMPGFPKVLQAVSEAYRARREQIDAQAEELTGAIAQAVAGEARGADAVTEDRIARATEKMRARFDEKHGGFGQRPKFPSTQALELLLRRGDHARVCKALDAMRAGGIWDHLGGGFHRYSTDERWLVPHFEKMLYDNALLLRLYAQAWVATGQPLYATTAREIAAYVAREMTAPEGGFYATQDADTEGEEGRFFVWTPAQIDEACAADPEAARVAKLAFGVSDEGNFEGSGASVLSRALDDDAVASALGSSPSEVRGALERARARLLASRERRERPFRDEKILASWNGLMAGALASAGAALGEPALVDAARRALEFVDLALVCREPGEAGERARVLRLRKDGVVRGPGFLDDHAFVADASLDLYEATGDPRWVRLARSIADAILAHFSDANDRDFFFTPDDGEGILVRPRDPFDHAVPSSAAVTCRVLLRLGSLIGSPYRERGLAALEKNGPLAADNPLGMSLTLALVDRSIRGSTEVVVVGPRVSGATAELARAAAGVFEPDRLLAWLDPTDPESVAACPALAEGKAAHSRPVAYVCRARACSLPLHTPDALVGALRSA